MVAYPDNDSYLNHSSTIDGGDFIKRLGYSKQDLYVNCNFRDLPIVSLDDSERLSSYSLPGNASCLDFFVYSNSHGNNHINNYFFGHKIFLNIGKDDIDGEIPNYINYVQTINRLDFYNYFDWVVRILVIPFSIYSKIKRMVFVFAKFILLKLKVYDSIKSYLARRS